MSNLSFSSGRQVTMLDTISDNRIRVEAYDPSYKFNRIVYSKPNKPLYDIYSIDPLKILQALDSNKLDSLYQITLLGRQIMREHISSGGTGMWDTLFNSAQQKALTACIFMVGNDYRPIPQERVAMSSQFLNFSMLVSRVQKNQVQPGDRVGIAIHDLKENLYYVLLYRVDDLCQVTMEPGRNVRSFLQPAVNLTMEHACRVEYDGKASIVDMEEGREYDAERAGPFVSYMARAVADINEAYPYKPHFTPTAMTRVEPTKLNARLDEEIPEAIESTWDDFKQLCRAAYEEARKTGTKDIPLVEVVTIVDEDRYVAKLESDYNPDDVSYSFAKSDLDGDALIETYFTNADLDDVDFTEVNTVAKLGATDTRGERLVRYFKVNY